jgi:hypothetical protein
MNSNFAAKSRNKVKVPILKEQFCTTGWIISMVLAAACLGWRFAALPGWEYATGVFLIGMTALLVLFAGETSRTTTQMVALVLIAGTGIVLMASRFDALMNGITFGPSLLPVNNQLGILSGLLWLLPVFTSLRIADKYTGNIYLRSLLGALFVLVPSIFVMLSSEWTLLLFWKQDIMPVKAVIVWFVAGFFFHFAINQMGAQKSNPVATRLYFVYLGFFIAAEVIHLLRPVV